MNKENKREKIFYIIMAIFYALCPVGFFFDVFKYKITKATGDGTGKTFIEYYNILEIGDKRVLPAIVGVAFMVVSLIVAICIIADLINGKFYRTDIKVLTGVSMILLACIASRFTIYLAIILFMTICFNLFILSFDLKLNAKDNQVKSNNVIIYVPMYVIFLLMLLCGLTFFGLW